MGLDPTSLMALGLTTNQATASAPGHGLAVGVPGKCCSPWGLCRPTRDINAVYKNGRHDNFASANKSLIISSFIFTYSTPFPAPPSHLALKDHDLGDEQRGKQTATVAAAACASPGRGKAAFPGAPQDFWHGWSATTLGCLMDGKCPVCRVLAELCDNSLYFFLYKLPH